MMTVDKILEMLIDKFNEYDKMEHFYMDLREQEEEMRHHKAAAQYDTMVEVYMARKREVANIYADIKNIDWVDAYKEMKK